MKKAFQIARRLVLVHSRQRARKVMFLLTDGLYTGKSPVNIAKALRQEGVEVNITLENSQGSAWDVLLHT